jgi:hypothetical protein
VAPVTNLCQQVFPALSREAKPLPQRPRQRAILLIDQIGIGEDQACLRMSGEFLLATLETIGIPDIVLVAERDQVPGTEPNGLFKILRGAQGLGVLHNRNREGNRGGEFANDGNGLIRRPVVTHHQLIRQPGLLLNAG